MADGQGHAILGSGVPLKIVKSLSSREDIRTGPGPRSSSSRSADKAPPGPSTSADPSARDGEEIEQHSISNEQPISSATTAKPGDPFDLSGFKRTSSQLKRNSLRLSYPKGDTRELQKYYGRQNELIDSFLRSADEENADLADMAENGPKVKFAQRGSFVVNVCLFIIQLYAAVSTGSLSLFATAADAFMDVVSSTIMLITTRMAAKPSIVKYPVGRRRMEIIGIILFCAIMTILAVELIVESARDLVGGPKTAEKLQIIPLIFVGVAIFSKSVMFVYCFLLRRYPGARIFMLDHRNDIVVNVFGLTMSIVGQRLVWWLDPAGAICIATLILYSWVSTAFEHVPLLVGESAPTDFLNKCVYLAVTHDSRITKIDTVRAYHAGQHYYVEMDIIMDENTPLRISHDVSQILQRKLEGFAEVERAFVHVDYEGEHSVLEEHKPPYELPKPKRSFFDRIRLERLAIWRDKVKAKVEEKQQPRQGVMNPANDHP